MSKKHIIIYTLLRPLVAVFLYIKFGYRFKVAKNLPEKYIVLSNHNTDFDPLFVAMSFPRQMYFVASEHIARWKNAYKFIKFALAPITRYKGAPANAAVIEIIRRIRKGASVCVFAEGVRSWDGVTCPILPSTAKLIKSAGCGLVTYKIIGGYFASPMWSGASSRRGRVYGSPVSVYTKEQIDSMSVDEIYSIITTDLYEDAYARQAESPKCYKGKRLAERLENLMFVCPSCGRVDTLASSGDTVSCNGCSHSFKYDEYGMLCGTRFKNLKEFSDWQKSETEKMVFEGKFLTAPLAKLQTVKNHTETFVAEGMLSISPEKISCGNIEISLSDITDMAMHGQKALVFSVGKTYYELLVKNGVNALKFLIYYEFAKNLVTTK